MSEFKYLFTPLKIGPVVMKNRILSTAHNPLYAKNSLPTQTHIDYYSNKAKGGVGLIITESMSVHPATRMWIHDGQIQAYLEGFCEEARKLVDSVHQHGTKIFAQLLMGGHLLSNPADTCEPITINDLNFPRRPFGPSSLPSNFARTMAQAMRKEDIDEVIKYYALAAKNCRQGGFDGIEVNAAHGYLLSTFLSPRHNRRTDLYGGPLGNRMRLLREVIASVCSASEREMAVGVRLNGDDLEEGGFGIDEARLVCQTLESDGLINFVNISWTTPATTLQNPPMYVPCGSAVYLAASVRDAIKHMPVFTVCRIIDPLHAEKVLAAGQADMVGMTRALIADPELPNKALGGRLDEIRECVGCNQGCVGRIATGRPMRCLQNPQIGREGILGELQRAKISKEVIVVGAGPAGLEASIIAAARSHKVTLFEKEKEIGGQAKLAALLPGREELGGVIRWRAKMLEKYNINLKLSTEATTETILEKNPDVVVIATGATFSARGRSSYLPPNVEAIPGSKRENVYTAWDILVKSPKLGKNIIVYDEDAHIEALGISELLADETRNVTLISRFFYAGSENDICTIMFPYLRCRSKGVRFLASCILTEIGPDFVKITDVWTKEETKIQNTDAVVLVTDGRKEPLNNLYFALCGKVKELYTIGDCVAPGKMDMAILDGHMLGRRI